MSLVQIDGRACSVASLRGVSSLVGATLASLKVEVVRDFDVRHDVVTAILAYISLLTTTALGVRGALHIMTIESDLFRSACCREWRRLAAFELAGELDRVGRCMARVGASSERFSLDVVAILVPAAPARHEPLRQVANEHVVLLLGVEHLPD